MRRKVLIVEDNQISRQILRGILEDDYDVCEAENGIEALKILKEQGKELSAVVLDLVMPKMDGFEVMDRMRKDSDMAQIPVMIATVTNDREIEGLALESGAIDYVQKPYDARILKSRLWNTIMLREQAAGINAVKRDALTGLLSRTAFFEHVKEAVAQKEPGYYIMSSFDIDRFKMINDQYGNAKGDEVLKQIANIFRQEFKKVGAVMSRIMADNFAILYPRSFTETKEIAEIRERASVLDGSIMPISYSIGRFYVDDITMDPSVMYDRAVIAKESVKGRYDEHIATYQEHMRNNLLSEQEIVNGMKKALKEHEFELWYQPQFSHVTGALIGAEALVRWRHPDKGIIMPGLFIPIFEKNGFIYELDKYVWEQACVFIGKRTQAGLTVTPISVNLSRYDIYRDDLIEGIKEMVTKYQIPAELLRFEITESAFEKSSERIINVVKELQAEGFTVEIDDFGSGYSSLNILKDVPADVVKLDMRFLEGEDNVNRGGSILESVVRMTKWLGMSVIAEGVEDLQQADFLKSIGCYYVQGYLYSKPIPQEEYEQLIAEKGYAEKMITIEKVQTFDNQAFWNPKSMDTLIFNSFVGGACIFEYVDGNIEIVRTNDEYVRILFGEGKAIDNTLSKDWYPYMSAQMQYKTRQAMQRAIKTQAEISDELELHDFGPFKKTIHLFAKMRVIARTGNRYLFYCVIEDITSLREIERHEQQLMNQLEIILKDMNGGVSVSQFHEDGSQKLLFANERFYEQRGYTKEQYEDEVENFFDIVYPDDVALLEEENKKCLDGNLSCASVYRIIKRDGTIIWIQSRMSVTDFNGYDCRLQIVISDDITQERESSDKEKKTQLLLNTILSNVGSGITAVILHDRMAEYLFSNDRFYEIIRYSREEYRLKAQDVFSLFHPDDRDRVYEAVMALQPGDKPLVLEYRVVGKDESIVNIRMTIVSMNYGEEGNIVQISVFEDITEECREEERQKELIENLPCGAGIFDYADGVLTMRYLNRKYWEMVGRTPNMNSNGSALNAIQEEDRAYALLALQRMVDTGKEQECELHILNGEGSYTPFLVRVNVMGQSPNVSTIYATYTLIEEDAIVFRQMLPVALEAMMSSSQDFSFVKDRSLTYVCASRTFANMVGYEDEHEIIGKTDFDLFPASIAKKYRIADHEVLDEGKSLVDYVERLPGPKDEVRYSSMSRYLLKDANGYIIGIYGTGRDITENREAYKRLMLLTDSIPGGLATYEISPKGVRTLYITEGVYRIIGYNEDDFRVEEKNALEFVYAEDRRELRKHINEMYRKKTPINCVFRIAKKDGTRCWVNLRGSVAEQYGNRMTVNTVLFDVNELKMANDKLELMEYENRKRYEKELQLRKGLIQNSVLYYQINLKTGVVEEFETKYANAALIKTGAKISTNSDASIVTKILPQDLEKVMSTVSFQALNKAYENGENSASVIYRRQLDDDTYKYVQTSAFIMKSPDNGEAIAFLNCNDIDHRMRSQLSIETILNEDIESVIYINVNNGIGAIAHMSDSVDYGSEIGDFIFADKSASWCETFVVGEDREVFRSFYNMEALVEKLSLNSSATVVYQLKGEKGIRRKLTKAYYLDYLKDYIVMTRRDITGTYEEEMRKKEELQNAVEQANKANKAKSDFLAHMSHDLRTPLNAVLAYSNQELVKDADEEVLKSYLNKVNVSGEYLLGIINNVLDMSSIEQNRIRLNPEPYFIEELESTVQNVIGELCRKRDIQFVMNVAKSGKRGIMADRVRLHQVFINLLSNAVKFTPKGGRVEFTVEDRKEEQSSVLIHFTVCDNGIGMSEEFLPHAFENFNQEYRGDVVEKTQGTGLGLPIVKELVQLMSGTISLKSELNKGTTFDVEIPFATVEQLEETSAKTKYDLAKLQGAHILLVEDNDINAEIAKELLEKYGSIVERAENGEIACEMFDESKNHYYGLILMDIRMPVMGGVAATKKIRSMARTDAASIPIIAMTADAFIEDSVVTRNAGMNDHIIKPVEPSILYKICCGYL